MKCVECGAKSQLFLCESHITELAEMFENLPEWLECALNIALRQTRGGPGAKRSTSDDSPALFMPDTENSKPSRQQQAGGLVVEIDNELVGWARHLAEAYGITINLDALQNSRGTSKLELRKAQNSEAK